MAEPKNANCSLMAAEDKSDRESLRRYLSELHESFKTKNVQCRFAREENNERFKCREDRAGSIQYVLFRLMHCILPEGFARKVAR